jgi:predicted nucleic acid-binding protein
VVLADSSPFIHLERIGRLDLLPLVFGIVEVPATIADEVLAGRIRGVNATDLRSLSWVHVHPDQIDPVVAAEPGLHRGEVTALQWHCSNIIAFHRNFLGFLG